MAFKDTFVLLLTLIRQARYIDHILLYFRAHSQGPGGRSQAGSENRGHSERGPEMTKYSSADFIAHIGTAD